MKILSIIALLFGFTQCGTSKLVKSPPFEISSAMYQNWIGGKQGSNGMVVTISYKSESKILFDSIYFLKSTSKLEMNEFNGKKTLLGTINNAVSSRKKDLILDSDPRKELNNEIPSLKKFPFELNDNEAVISYKEGKKTKYFKIENLKKGNPIIHQ